MTELLNCPFCGGEAEYHSDKGPTGEVYAWVGCNQCDAMSCHIDVRSMQPEETHPIDAWNTRASDAEITRLTEALRAAEEREKALRDDADRYHWLRDHSCPPHNFYISVPDEFAGQRYGPNEVDAYIDAARAALKEQPHD